MRREIWISLALLGALLIGVMLGETGIASRAVDAVKVRLTGRLPLRDWEISSPTSFRSGLWYLSPWEEKRELYHRVAWRQGMLGVLGLKLELTLPPIAFSLYNLEEKGGFQLSIESYYIGRGPKLETYSGQELAIISRATGDVNDWGDQSVTLMVLLEPDYRLTDVVLHVEGELTRIEINRAELILR